MLVIERSSFVKGTAMTVVFLAVLVAMFSPLFSGENAFRAADRLFNSIAKGSSYAIDRLIAANREVGGQPIEMELTLADEAAATLAASLLQAAGATATVQGPSLSLRGDLQSILAAALADADAMFFNRGQEVQARHGRDEREVLHTWWTVLKEMYREAKARGQFEEARRLLDEVRTRAVEVSYNFYRIEPTRARDHAGILAFSLLFYVAYTLWWGYAILFLFDGFGLQMKPAHKREA